MKNNFPNSVRELFIWNYECWECGRNSGLELHHILGRRSNSPLNAAPLCRRCHSPEGNRSIHSSDFRYLRKTLRYLVDQGYELSPADKEFISIYKEFYEK